MKAITKTECEKVFIKYAYTAIRESGQFNTACIKWKVMPEKDKKTNRQCRAIFSKKYTKYLNHHKILCH
jgi:hypothetical protein